MKFLSVFYRYFIGILSVFYRYVLSVFYRYVLSVFYRYFFRCVFWNFFQCLRVAPSALSETGPRAQTSSCPRRRAMRTRISVPATAAPAGEGCAPGRAMVHAACVKVISYSFKSNICTNEISNAQMKSINGPEARRQTSLTALRGEPE